MNDINNAFVDKSGECAQPRKQFNISAIVAPSTELIAV